MINVHKRTHWSEHYAENDKRLQLNNNICHDAKLLPVINTFTSKTITKYPDLPKAYSNFQRICNISLDQVLLTSGADQAIYILINALKSQYNTITIPEPTFAMVRVYSELYQYDISTIKYDYVYELNRFNLNIHTNTDIIYIASPDNFTGYSISESAINRLCEQYSIVIYDNVYGQYDSNDINVQQLIRKHDNLYIVGSFSKSYMAPGLRIGYILSQSNNITVMTSYKPMYEINSISCDYIEYVADNLELYNESISRLLECKKYLEDKFQCVDDTNGNYVVIRYTDKVNQLISKHISTKQFNINNNKFVRLTLADIDTLKPLIK